MTESTRPTRTRWVRVGALALLLALGAAACGSASTASTDELDASIAKMSAATSYSFAATITAGSDSVRVAGDFHAPNLIAETITKGSSTPVAMVLDGGTVHVRDSSGNWSSKPATDATAVDLRATFTALTAHTNVKREGSSWTFTVSGDAAKALAGTDTTGDVKVTATTGDAGLTTLRYEVTTGGRRLVVTIDYSSIGTAPKVVVPT